MESVDLASAVLLTAKGVVVEFSTSTRKLPLQGSGSSRITRAVDRVSFQIVRGETFGLVGESGSGKTTIGRAMLRLAPLNKGSVEYAGRDLYRLSGHELRDVRKSMQMIYQNPYSSLDPHMNAGEIVAEPLRISGISRRAAAIRAQESIELAGLTGVDLKKKPREFSGGQRQRIAIARAIATRPQFIVCDEPSSALDVSVQAQVINLLRNLQSELGLTYLFISHDLAVVAQIAQRVAVMYRGRIVEIASSESLSGAMKHPYSISLLSSVGRFREVERTRGLKFVIPGDSSSTASSGGCRFKDRCWLNGLLGHPVLCETEEPELTMDTNGGAVACHYSNRVTDYLEAAG